MPSRTHQDDVPCLLIALGPDGAISSAQVYYAHPAHTARAAEARASIMGLSRYQAFRIIPGKGGNFEFKPLKSA